MPSKCSSSNGVTILKWAQLGLEGAGVQTHRCSLAADAAEGIWALEGPG